jgi:hypothetical protein
MKPSASEKKHVAERLALENNPGTAQPSPDALGNQAALKLSHGAEDREHHLAAVFILDARG